MNTTLLILIIHIGSCDSKCRRSVPFTKMSSLTFCSSTGRAVEAVRSLIISQQLVGTREIVVIHHTDCGKIFQFVFILIDYSAFIHLQGMLTFKDADLRAKVKKGLNCSADHIAFLPFDNLEDSVREDVEFLKSNPFMLKNIPITGFIYDVKTGKLNQVV